MRYQFYREHKFVSSALNDVERQIAKTDFCDPLAVASAKQSFDALKSMLIMHARFEDERVHSLLRAKASHVHEHAEGDHEQQHAQMDALTRMFDDISRESRPEKKIAMGYSLYLSYRKFLAENLLHLHEEETVILAELQRLYSDDELRSVPAMAYREMTPDDMTHMVQGLFPHMNKHDRFAFLSTMRTLEPQKFSVAWQQIRGLLSGEEQRDFD